MPNHDIKITMNQRYHLLSTFFHILTNVRYVEFTSNTYIIDTRQEEIYQEYDGVLL